MKKIILIIIAFFLIGCGMPDKNDTVKYNGFLLNEISKHLPRNVEEVKIIDVPLYDRQQTEFIVWATYTIKFDNIKYKFMYSLSDVGNFIEQTNTLLDKTIADGEIK